MRKLATKFTFAGFSWPRYVPEITRDRKPGKRVACTYYHAPTPNATGSMSFYLDDFGSPSRWKWCDDVNSRIQHKGWYTDEFGDGDTIRGIVVYLSHGRAVAGWCMGVGMCGEIFTDEVFTDDKQAARRADGIAEAAAENEREYQEQENERIREEEERLELCEGSDEEETGGY